MESGPEPLYQSLLRLFKLNPWRSSLALLVLLLAIITVALLSIDGAPLMVVAFIQLVPLIVIIIDSVRDRLGGKESLRWPRWVFVIVYAIVIFGSGGLLFGARDLYSSTLLVSLLAVFITLLPRVLSTISLALSALPYAGKHLKNRASAANLYLLLMLVLTYLLPKLALGEFWSGLLDDIVSLQITEEVLVSFGLIFLTWVPAVIWRDLLWKDDDQRVFARFLPHFSAGLLISGMLLLILDEAGINLLDDVVVAIFGVFLISPIAIAYWTLQNLQGFTVKPLKQALTERSDSIQSDSSDYIDVHGHSARLLSSIQRSDAGVFGVTGVRGAGKSALTRHVLSQLREQYFVLEMTAPVRHDTDMGFFISVCRSVSRKVMDDLEVILSGRQSGDAAQLKRRFRNATLGILLGLAGISWLWHFSIISEAEDSAILTAAGQDSVYEFGNDRLLRFSSSLTQTLEAHIILATERRIIDKLLLQIDAVLAGQAESDKRLRRSTRYLLLPLASGNGFYLATDHEPYQPEVLLNVYKQTLEPNSLNTDGFLNIVIQVANALCSTRRSDFYDGYTNGLIVGGFRRLEGQVFYNEFCYGSLIKTEYDDNVILETISGILNHEKIKAPLVQLNRELRDQLFTRPVDEADASTLSEIPADKSEITAPIETNLVSLLILEAFEKQDVRLSFDSERLEILRQLLKIYRRLLDGEATELAFSSSAAVQDLKSPASMLSYLPRPTQDSIFAILFWLAVLLIILVLSAGPIWRAFISLARAVINRRYLNLYHEASKFIEFLSWSSSQQDSRSFGFKGLSLGRTSSKSARDLTLPGLNARYLAFIRLIRKRYNRKVIIVIDELDKIHDPEQVKALLTEIKGALFSKGCFYLISISEDAARSFRYRLTSGRDIFESTFDEIVEIQQMDVPSAISMLSKREEDVEHTDKLPESFGVLLVLFAGGIPREIIRSARALSMKMETTAENSYHWACQFLLTEELANWISHFGETNLNGNETVKLKDSAQKALQQIDTRVDVNLQSYAMVSGLLQTCLKIIDPEELRKSVGFVVNVQSAAGMPEEFDEKRFLYHTLAADIQACLRLIILSTVAELTEKTDNDWEKYEQQILACHHALGDKPALAEELLYELRNQFEL